ncbi:aspartyl protease [Myriangium duriaei CBS 260.36]|uniref:Aspartyl protease n=1 Tax=Myriangium duriaei CBS 260.36 TaxID=1168546 RepID=A0A9P4IUV4_9PEZI|nr:aspartyl protease [Myriangium duriaei CBS 260.36]
MLKTYAKYGKLDSAPAKLKAAAAAGQSGSVTATPEGNDEAYLCPVTLGGQTLNLDFDTGSADLWVFSTLTPSSESTGHAKYNPTKSGKKQSGETWNISYGDGSGAKGTVYADKVVVGGVTATSQIVEAATSVSSEFTQDTDNDGLLGLAFSSINTVSPRPATTFFDTVKSSLAKPLFTARLRKGAPGSYDFGVIDTSLYTGSITYVPVDNSQGFWGFTAGTYSVNGQRGSSIGSAIADTGTTLLYVPDAAVSDYYSNVQSAQNSDQDGGYIFDCSEDLPDFVVKIGTGSFTVPGSYINFQDNGDGTCFGGLQSNSGIGLTIFGDIFLKAQFVVFDESQSSPRIGFAKGA